MAGRGAPPTGETDAPPERAGPEPPWWRPPRPGRRRQPLSRQAIIDAALKILDEEGADALTVRRLGEALNTGSSTLYWHIANKEELGEIVYDHVMGAITLPEPDPAHWQEQLKTMARQAYRAMLAHKEVVRFSIGRIPVGPNMLRVMEWSLELLRQAGIPDLAAAYAGDIFGRYLDASVLELASPGGRDPETVGMYFAGLPAGEFPNMVGLAERMIEGSDDDRFEFGLELFVRGLAAFADRGPRRRRR